MGARTGRRGVTSPLFRLRGGFLGSPWVTFPKAPLRSRTVGFPESGSDLGSARHLAGCGPSHASGSSSAGAHTPLARIVYPHPRLAPNPHDSSSMSGYVLGQRNHRVPRAPLPEVGVTHRRGGLECHLREHYSSFIAHTDSCVGPTPSRCLGISSYTGSLQVVTSPCWAMALPDIISAILA